MTGLDELSLNGYSELTNFLVKANKSQMQEELKFSGPIGFLCLTELNLSGCVGIKAELDSWMQPDYFPLLTYLNLDFTSIVTIPESISRFTGLQYLSIRDCKKLQNIPRLPQSIRIVDAQNCYRLDPQSTSRLWNQVSLFLSL